MAVGVAVANAILLVAFAENARQTGIGAAEGAMIGAEERFRAILMTSIAMIVGMIPLALGLGEGAEQSAPLGRAVIGGLSVATAATLLILPAIFTVVMRTSKIGPATLHPDDPDGAYYAPESATRSQPHGHEHPSAAHGEAQPANSPDSQSGRPGADPKSTIDPVDKGDLTP